MVLTNNNDIGINPDALQLEGSHSGRLGLDSAQNSPDKLKNSTSFKIRGSNNSNEPSLKSSGKMSVKSSMRSSMES